MIKHLIFSCLFIFFVNSPAYALELSAESACLISADTKEIIFSKNEHEKMPMASTTKIMTGLLASEYHAPDELVTVSQNAASQEGSSIYLKAGEKITLNDLAYGLMLNSGNDAAVAIAEHIGKSVPAFAEMMTKKAGLIGALNTQFKNPNGLDEAGHYTTAYDLAQIAAHAMKNENFAKIVSQKNAVGKLSDGHILYFKNHNKLLDMYNGATGVKTGFTKASGRCLVSAAERNGISLIAVTLNAPDDWNDHKKMLDYGFENIDCMSIVKKGDVLKTIKTQEGEFSFISQKDINATTSSKHDFKIVLHLPDHLPAPMNKDEKAGYGEVFYKDSLFSKFDILSQQDIPLSTKKEEKESFASCLLKVFFMIFK